MHLIDTRHGHTNLTLISCRYLVAHNIKIKLNEADNCVKLKNGKIILIENIATSSTTNEVYSGTLIIGQSIISKKNFINVLDCIQHVPYTWYSLQNNPVNNENTERCWFPFSKSEAAKTSVSFSSQQIYIMILKCSVPNNIYGCWYNVKQVAGPFDSELVARNGSKYWSGMNESDNDTRRHGIVDNKADSNIKKSSNYGGEYSGDYSSEPMSQITTEKSFHTLQKPILHILIIMNIHRA
ncbi:GATA zinc finger domain-containing protein 4-like [Aphis craccivora]|uniref:GATA zinc finger domain-containing protein 4-like n=1 Tax=Aphis craccivora TaxID=307492 RepID=A0A6G0YGM3_APHCR|nr:GATA zinc finger domain-containing protein 4-like [Aphis craccivora]